MLRIRAQSDLLLLVGEGKGHQYLSTRCSPSKIQEHCIDQAVHRFTATSTLTRLNQICNGSIRTEHDCVAAQTARLASRSNGSRTVWIASVTIECTPIICPFSSNSWSHSTMLERSTARQYRLLFIPPAHLLFPPLHATAPPSYYHCSHHSHHVPSTPHYPQPKSQPRPPSQQ